MVDPQNQDPTTTLFNKKISFWLTLNSFLSNIYLSKVLRQRNIKQKQQNNIGQRIKYYMITYSISKYVSITIL